MKQALLVGALALLSATSQADTNFEKWTIITPEFEKDFLFEMTERTFSKKDSLVFEKNLTSPDNSTKTTYIGQKNTYKPSLVKTHPIYGVGLDAFSKKTDNLWEFSPYSDKAFNDISTRIELTTIDLSGKPIVRTVDTARAYLREINALSHEDLKPQEKKWLTHKDLFPKGAKCVRFESIVINTPYLEYQADSARPFDLSELGSSYSPPRKFAEVTFYLDLEDEESSLIKIKDKLYNGSFTSEGNYYSRQDEISMLDDSIAEAKENNELNIIPLYQSQQLELQNSCNAYNDVATNAVLKILK